MLSDRIYPLPFIARSWLQMQTETISEMEAAFIGVMVRKSIVGIEIMNTHRSRSDLPAAFHCEILAPDANGDDIGDGSGFYWSDGAEVNSWHRDNEHSLVFKDTPKLPSGFLAAGDGQQFVTRLVGVKQGGGCAFIGHLTGFTWHSDAVCDPQ